MAHISSRWVTCVFIEKNSGTALGELFTPCISLMRVFNLSALFSILHTQNENQQWKSTFIWCLNKLISHKNDRKWKQIGWNFSLRQIIPSLIIYYCHNEMFWPNCTTVYIINVAVAPSVPQARISHMQQIALFTGTSDTENTITLFLGNI